MESVFDCPHCHQLHAEPADAILGIRAACLDCSAELELLRPRPRRPLPAAA